MEQQAHGFDVWAEPFVTLRLPNLVNLQSAPFERAHRDSVLHEKWCFDHAFVLVPAQTYVSKWPSSFKDFQPRQSRAASASTRLMEKLAGSAGN